MVAAVVASGPKCTDEKTVLSVVVESVSDKGDGVTNGVFGRDLRGDESRPDVGD